MQKFIQNVEKFGADAPILHIYHNITRIENNASRSRLKKAAKNGEEIHIPEIWVGEKIRIFGQNIHPWAYMKAPVKIKQVDIGWTHRYLSVFINYNRQRLRLTIILE